MTLQHINMGKISGFIANWVVYTWTGWNTIGLFFGTKSPFEIICMAMGLFYTAIKVWEFFQKKPPKMNNVEGNDVCL